MEKIQHEDGSTEEKVFYDDQLDHIYFNDKDGRVYKHQQFKNGQLESTSSYDKDGNLVKKINKKGDEERRQISDVVDGLDEQMAPSPLRQRLKRAMVKEYRQTHPKVKKGVEY